jgi:hypothetical protein
MERSEMLNKEENELLTRVGPGTPMGNLMRQYWLPAMMSSELPAPDCPPVRIRLLGENACPHRGASMFFGRNEEEGLRCVYHGWKFDTSGACVDMPSEPAESNFKNKVRITAYKTRERGGLVWVYMGPRAEPPALPELEANMLPDGEYTLGAYSSETTIPSTSASCTRVRSGPRSAPPAPSSTTSLRTAGPASPPRTPSSAAPTAATAPPRRTPPTGAWLTSSSPSTP